MTPVKGSLRSEPIEEMGKPRAEAASVWIMALKPRSTLPEPMISVTSWRSVRRGREKIGWVTVYAGVIGLEQSDLDAFIFEVAFALGKVEGRVVRGSVPVSYQSSFLHWSCDERCKTHQLVKKVIFSVDMLTCPWEIYTSQYAKQARDGVSRSS
jgi:hypothetical protein